MILFRGCCYFYCDCFCRYRFVWCSWRSNGEAVLSQMPRCLHTEVFSTSPHRWGLLRNQFPPHALHDAPGVQTQKEPHFLLRKVLRHQRYSLFGFLNNLRTFCVQIVWFQNPPFGLPAARAGVIQQNKTESQPKQSLQTALQMTSLSRLVPSTKARAKLSAPMVPFVVPPPLYWCCSLS